MAVLLLLVLCAEDVQVGLRRAMKSRVMKSTRMTTVARNQRAKDEPAEGDERRIFCEMVPRGAR